MFWEAILSGVPVLALMIYALTGGGDCGACVWRLLACEDKERRLIGQRFGPVQAAGHLWLVLSLVVLAVTFPPAMLGVIRMQYAPLAVIFIGLLLRGLFIRRKQHPVLCDVVIGLGTPMSLGMCLAALSTGAVDDHLGFMSMFGVGLNWAMGALTLVMSSMVAAVTLACRTSELDLQNTFRVRALITLILACALIWACVATAQSQAPFLHEGMTAKPWSFALHVSVGFFAVLTLIMLLLKRYAGARFAVAGFVVLMILSWALAQFPYLVYPVHTITNASAPESVLAISFWFVIALAVTLGPGLALLGHKPKR